MEITLNEEFRNLIQNNSSYIELGPATIAEVDYPAQYIYTKDLGELQIFLDLSNETGEDLINVSQIDFNYTDLLTGIKSQSFTITGDIQLLLGRNLFQISGLDRYWFASFKYNQDSQVKFLESPGNGIGGSLYNDDYKFTTITSYRLYIQEVQCFDKYDHLQTTYYNNFGIRTY